MLTSTKFRTGKNQTEIHTPSDCEGGLYQLSLEDSTLNSWTHIEQVHLKPRPNQPPWQQVRKQRLLLLAGYKKG